MIFLEISSLDAIRDASEACDQTVGFSTVREQTSEATKKWAKHGSSKRATKNTRNAYEESAFN